MNSTEVKTLVQCDFDNTIAEFDVSFMLLDAFADGDWRQILQEYRERKIPVGVFSQRTFNMIKADKATMVDYLFTDNRARIRPGFKEMLDLCSRKGFEFIIVSNGLKFYIDAILKHAGVTGIDVFAAHTEFNPDGLKITYVDPDGQQVLDKFKQLYVERHLSRGYRVAYIGDGYSDIMPATLSHHVFARDDLLAHYQRNGLKCAPFNDLKDVVKGLERID
jgi:2-hydroxy-3-keto-5-methylthiopentenyl-1-phosphate phosphatase